MRYYIITAIVALAAAKAKAQAKDTISNQKLRKKAGAKKGIAPKRVVQRQNIH